MDLKIEANTGATAAEFRDYPSRVRKGLVRALNRAIASGRTVMVREIARDIGLKAKDVRDQMAMMTASMDRPSVSLRMNLTRLPLSVFGARQTARGVTYKIGAGGRNRIPNAFIATVRGPLPTGVVSPGHTGVFVRQGKSRLPISQRYGPSLGHVFAKYRPAGIARIDEALTTNLEHELAFAAKQEAANAGTD